MTSDMITVDIDDPPQVTITAPNNGDTVTATEILVSGLPEFDEPTLGQVVGDQLLVVANSHWNRFNANNELDQNNLTGPVILRIKLQ